MKIYKINVHPVDFLKLGPDQVNLPCMWRPKFHDGLQSEHEELECSSTTLTAPSLFVMDANICGTIREPKIKTRMHSSGMRTVSQLALHRGCLPGGGCLPRGGVCL